MEAPKDEHMLGERKHVRELLAETQAISARLAALNEVATAMQASLDLERVLQTMAREARWILDFQYCSAAERLGDSYVERILKSPFKATPSTRRTRLDKDPISKSIAQGHALLLFTAEDVAGSAPGMQSGLIVPLRAEGVVIGTLNFFAEQPGHYTLDDLRVISALAAQVSAAAQNSRLFREVTEARQHLSTILESIKDGVVVLNESGRVTLLNSAAQRLLQLPVGTLGRGVFFAAARAGGSGQRLITPAQLKSLLREFQDQGGGTLHLSDGRHLEWAVAPLQDAHSTPGFVISLSDISHKMALEELRDDMIGMLVHDLRTPLTGILLSLDMLNNVRETKVRGIHDSELLDRAGESARQLLRHVNALLDLRKLEAGRLELEVAPIQPGRLIANVMGRLQLLAELGEMQLTTVIEPELPPVAVDQMLIERVLENLIGNAIKFTDERGTVTAGASLLVGATPALEIFVSDTGYGVPPELRTLIFEKYGQVRNAKARRGTGLGLTFCKLAVEAHGGRIGLRDTPGGGSTFWFTLPIAAAF
jgi:NtrC-family two-component system sensor histidine kinase KinB